MDIAIIQRNEDRLVTTEVTIDKEKSFVRIPLGNGKPARLVLTGQMGIEGMGGAVSWEDVVFELPIRDWEYLCDSFQEDEESLRILAQD